MTGSTDYLSPYEGAVSRLPSQIDMLDRETMDNSRQRTPVAALRSAVRTKLSELAAAIELARLGRTDEAVAVMRGGAGHAYIARVTQPVERLRGEERRLLAERTASAGRITVITLVRKGAIVWIPRATMSVR